jgi:DNA-binding NtrC family response regulator
LACLLQAPKEIICLFGALCPEVDVLDVLIVDRDLRSARALIPRLNAWAYRAEVVETLQQAIECLSLQACHSVILAVYANQGDAAHAITTIYQANPKTRIVAVGDQSSLELERAVRLSKVFYYMLQPIDFEELRAVIRRAVGEFV